MSSHTTTTSSSSRPHHNHPQHHHHYQHQSSSSGRPSHHRHYQTDPTSSSKSTAQSHTHSTSTTNVTSPPTKTTYESILNSTLLFFVEKLIEKSPRTLHDLSCQFGSPSFSREMRAIAGNSQAGLKKFLTSHSYLFTLNPDDTVICTPTIKNDSSSSSSAGTTDGSSTTAADHKGALDKDTLQAIEYFQKRLLQYGPNVAVPIKSLQGHRSQAPLVIRHIVGQQFDQFVQFLKRHDNVFKLQNDEVCLVVSSSSSLTTSNDDNQNLGGSGGGDGGYGSGAGSLQFGTNNNLLFGKEQHVVVDTEKVGNLIRYVQSCIDNHGPMLIEQLFHCIAVQFESDQLFKTPADLSTFLRMQNIFEVHSKLVTLAPHQQQQKSSFSQRSGAAAESSLHDKAKVQPTPNFIVGLNPKSNTSVDNTSTNFKHSSSLRNVQKQQQQSPKSMESPFVSNNNNTFSAPSSSKPPRKLQRNVVNNVILQTINSNATELPSDNIIIISNVRKGKSIIETQLAGATALGLDCEGVNLGPEGQITLIQIGSSANVIYIFDMLVDGMNDILKPILESETIVKVMHDCRNDSVNLHNQYGINLANVFDSQIGYMVTKSESKNISLNALCSELHLEGNTLKDKVKSIYRYDPKYWLRRPLTKQMLNYASSDVTSLLQIYNLLLPLIPDMDNFNDLCLEQINVLILPNEIRQKKRLRKNQQDLELLKQKFISCCNPSKLVLSNREIRLMKHLELPLETIQQLPMKIYKKLVAKSPTNQHHHHHSAHELSATGGGIGSNNSDNDQPNSLEPISFDSLLTTIDSFLERHSGGGGGGEGEGGENPTTSDHINAVVEESGPSNLKATEKKTTYCEIGTQTISTGDIVLTRVYCEDEDEDKVGSEHGAATATVEA